LGSSPDDLHVFENPVYPKLTIQIIVHEWIIEEGLLIGVSIDDKTTNEIGLVRDICTHKPTGKTNLTVFVYIHGDTLTFHTVGKF
jgi:hypothetical protein